MSNGFTFTPTDNESQSSAEKSASKGKHGSDVHGFVFLILRALIGGLTEA